MLVPSETIHSLTIFLTVLPLPLPRANRVHVIVQRESIMIEVYNEVHIVTHSLITGVAEAVENWGSRSCSSEKIIILIQPAHTWFIAQTYTAFTLRQLNRARPARSVDTNLYIKT